MSFDLWNNQADIADPRAVFAAQQAPQAHMGGFQPKQNTNTHGNFLTHLLPAIGGTGGGALGGALAGSAVLPGVGTLVGALLGGALGGAGGKAVENKVEGQNIGHDVLREGLINGAFSAGPIRLLKGAGALAKTAPEVATGGRTLADALTAAGTKAAGASIVKTAVANKTG
jgi:hypothetical protein